VTNAKGDQVERLPESSNVWDGAFPTRHEGPPPPDFVPKNRKDRRALAAYQRKGQSQREEQK
jgi:hypothetical protein